MTAGRDHLLFSYGTLRLPAVQAALFGREVVGIPDALPGFALEMVTIADADVVGVSGLKQHPILRRAKADIAPIEGVALGNR